ncbi:centromere protein H isoform X3 [Physeter macrocephalus]|uniref:Centromere protein H isoform X3 n=1 Tax=Physeter macrocephalus TaxID=9755 RepID=A0A9W2WTV5_PHYMC|nr:centromere protein H isoform X3 [Physeter catodon]
METQSEEQAAAEAADSRGEGEPPQVAGAQAARPEDRLTLLLRVRAQTKQQLLEYKSMFDANEEKTPEQIMQEKQIEAKIEELEKEIEEAKVAFEMKKLALDRMQLSSAVKKHLEKINTKTSVLMDNMKQILSLNKLVMKSQQETRDLEGKLLDVRKKRLLRSPLTVVASPVAEHRLSGHCSRAQPLCGTCDLPGPGHEPVSPASAGGLSTLAPPGKPFLYFLNYKMSLELLR